MPLAPKFFSLLFCKNPLSPCGNQYKNIEHMQENDETTIKKIGKIQENNLKFHENIGKIQERLHMDRLPTCQDQCPNVYYD